MFLLPRHFDIIFAKCFGVIFLFVYHDFGISVKEYACRGRNNMFPDIDRCPLCRGVATMYRHGFYWRNAITDKKFYRIPICRLKCSSCLKTVSVLPTFLLRYFQYTVNTIITKLKCFLADRSIVGYRQLVLFYRKRFLNKLNFVEMFFAAPPNK